MLRKRLCYFLALTLLMVLVAGCTPQTDPVDTPTSAPPDTSTPAEPDESEEPDEDLPEIPSEITMFVATPLASPTPPWESTIGQKIQELTGVNLKVEYLVGTDSMTKANLMVTSGVYPDIVAAGETAGVFTSADAFVQLDDMIEKYGENIKRIYRPSEMRISALENDGIYIIATNRPGIDNLYPGAAYYLNYDVLKDAGFPVVKTITQYSDLIKNYLANNPKFGDADTVGFTIPTEGYRVSALQYGAPRFLGGYPNDGVTAVDQETLEAKIVMNMPVMKDYLVFMNDLWNSGAMDKEVFMQKDDEYLAKIASGRVLGIYDQRWAVLNAFTAMESNGHHDRTLVGFPVIADGIEREYYRGPYAFSVQGVSITTAAKNPEGIFRFLDRICAEDIQKLTNWGIEGEHYTIEGGKFTRTMEQWQNSFDQEYKFASGLEQFDFLPRYERTNDEEYAKFSDGNWVSPAMNQEYNEVRYRDYEREILASYNIDTFNDFFAPAYPARYQPGWAARQQLAQDSPEYIASDKALEMTTEYCVKIVTAKPDEVDGLFEKFMTEMNAIPGLNDYEQKITEMVRATAEQYKN